ncbi:MAG: DNA-processing protein DprA [Lachnospiraceae bacterium]|nr:DNA-processing protein DprA [Lachnospiraceae bacterium]
MEGSVIFMKQAARNKEYDLWWAMSAEAGIRSVQLCNKAGGSESLFLMDKGELLDLGVSEKGAEHIIYRRKTWDYEKQRRILLEEGIRFVPWYDRQYPKRLLQASGYPFALFVKGELPDETAPAVALIGARECSEYGRLCAEYFGRELAACGVNVISGMAIGIDGITQQSALAAGGKSYAVLGCGPDICYPPANRNLYGLLAGNGGLISEYGPRVKAVAWHFPARNRIIAGLSDVVIVVEAKAKSGTLITADMALDAGREVLVVPGRITDPMSVGCMNLWKTGASPAMCVEDVLDVLAENKKMQTCDVGKQTAVLDEEPEQALESEEKLVYSCVDLYARSTEDILERTGLSYQDLLRILTELEFKGLIRETGRGYYVRATG